MSRTAKGKAPQALVWSWGGKRVSSANGKTFSVDGDRGREAGLEGQPVSGLPGNREPIATRVEQLHGQTVTVRVFAGRKPAESPTGARPWREDHSRATAEAFCFWLDTLPDGLPEGAQ